MFADVFYDDALMFALSSSICYMRVSTSKKNWNRTSFMMKQLNQPISTKFAGSKGK